MFHSLHAFLTCVTKYSNSFCMEVVSYLTQGDDAFTSVEVTSMLSSLVGLLSSRNTNFPNWVPRPGIDGWFAWIHSFFPFFHECFDHFWTLLDASVLILGRQFSTMNSSLSTLLSW